MASIHKEIPIQANAEKVWAVVRDIGAVHKGMKISNNEFDAMVGDIKASMDRLKVPTREQRDLLAIVETTRKQIVEKP